MNENLLTPQQAARLKGVSRAAIYRAIAEGRLPRRRILGRLALRKADVLHWMPEPYSGRRKGTAVSPQTKERIAAAQRKRWEQRRRMGLGREGAGSKNGNYR